MPIYKCRNWYLHTSERRIIKDGGFLEITPKSFDVLQLLIEKKGEIVTKDEILGQIWNGSFVEEGNLPVHISKLRRNLGETKTDPIIETVQGVGYRFIAPLKFVEEDEWANLILNLKINQSNNNQDDIFIGSVAVLPLDNSSEDHNIDYVVDGITENLINQLSNISNLKVTPRVTVYSLTKSKIDINLLFDKLKVSIILTGRIRRSNELITLTVELTNALTKTQIWGNSYSFNIDQLAEIQLKVFSDVLFQINTFYSPKIFVASQIDITNNSESYRLYLKGRFLKEKRTFEHLNKALLCFEESLKYDPLNLFSYVEILETYFSLYISDFLRNETAIKLINPIISTISEFDQSIDVVHCAFGGKSLYFDWDFIESEKHFQKALGLNPNCLLARYRYADLLLSTGRFSDAFKELQNIINIDPLSPITYRQLGKFFYRMKRYENAIKYLVDAIEIDSNDYIALAIYGACCVEQGYYDESIKYFTDSMKIQYHLDTLSMIGYTYALQGNSKKASDIIDSIENESVVIGKSATKIARIYTALNNKNKAFYYLNLSLVEKDPDLITLKTDPRFEKLKDDLRFNKLLIQIGIPV